ncbi:hypothetical protein [Bernardetia sp. MNP-M8]|uniref:hypothetical protein n=1 Tax=Bernardetia sp. MNP-M8 TaxID=3127470 RepID=UPI0030D4A403
MNTAPLELDNLSRTIIALFSEKNAHNFLKKSLIIIFSPVLYVAFWIIALFVYFLIREVYSQKVSFTNAEEYRKSRIAYDETLIGVEEFEANFNLIKRKNRIWYFIFYPMKVMFYFPSKWYCKKVKKEFEKLDRPTKEGDIFETITEQEMWEERPSAYEYRI